MSNPISRNPEFFRSSAIALTAGILGGIAISQSTGISSAGKATIAKATLAGLSAIGLMATISLSEAKKDVSMALSGGRRLSFADTFIIYFEKRAPTTFGLALLATATVLACDYSTLL